MGRQHKILIVDDEATIRRILATRLSMVGYEIVVAADGVEALEQFEAEKPDLIVLDVMMPRMNGLQVCQTLRESTGVPIIMLTALGEVSDRIKGLELGADDYLPKPFSPKELESRIQAILRRTVPGKGKAGAGHAAEQVIMEIGPLRIETHKRQVYLHGQRIQLTGIEFDVLKLLVSKAGQTVSRSDILQQVWGYSANHYADLRVVDVNVSRLRSKIGDSSKQPEYIHTDWGIGYFFQKMRKKSPEQVMC
ncbi:two-component transcriptional regulator [Acaryochloris marina MBIC11017]|uniref:Probable transcriptional regulator ycf27 n=1 Tax=Acaryochloris marina (strain MBIC 11017) TaxID=329726 RepID=B0C783_ACAM1|nr:response regulator [Acaryochloris marina]ABW30060.1 two-component transcriptional regulator [Acaryochloris marina MBIC11017]BDM78915.1 DNA-binding response regulator [Acaryochloris marina MBIC10699]